MRLAFARRQAIVQLMFTSTVLALLLVQPLSANDAPLAVATVAANETTSLCTFDPASLASLQLGDAFPPAFAALGAHIDAKSRARFAAMQLVRRACDASGELFVFEHPQAQAVHALLRAQLQAATGRGDQMKILYGGSVKASNAVQLFGMPDIDGGLIGGAALVAGEFAAICRAASR